MLFRSGGGRDLEDVLRERDRELKMMQDLGLMFDTDPNSPINQPKAAAPQAQDQEPNSNGDGNKNQYSFYKGVYP